MDRSRQRLLRCVEASWYSGRRDTVDGDFLAVAWMTGHFNEQSQNAPDGPGVQFTLQYLTTYGPVPP
jgi:hypothetical protein